MKKSDFLKIRPGGDIAHAQVNVEDAQMKQFNSIRERIQRKRKERNERKK